MPSAIDWSRAFLEPIALPDGRILRTLREAADYIQKLPKQEHDQLHWQIAVEHLIYGAERAPAWMEFARIAFLQALNHGAPPPAPRKKAVKTYKIVR